MAIESWKRAWRRRGQRHLESLEPRWAMAVEPFSVEGVAFASPQVTPVVSNQEQIQASTLLDLNQDGRSDLIYSVYDSKNLHVRLAQHDGSFAAAQTFPLPSTASHFAAGDLNNDGLPDLVIGSDTQTVTMVSQRGPNGQWLRLAQTQTFSGVVSSLALGDLDRDGALDLVIGRQDRVDVRLGLGTGEFGAAIRYTTERGDRRVAVADLDGDNDLDLVIGTSLSDGARGQVTVLLNDGGGVFENEAAKFSIGYGALSIRLIDLDANGRQDLIVGHAVQEDGNLSVWNGLGNGTFEPTPRRHEILGAPEVLQFADLNNDGRLDFIIGHRGTFHHPINGNGSGGVSVIVSKPEGFGEAIRLTTPDVKAIEVRDMDGDGRQDLVTVDYQNLTIHRARATTWFSSEATHYRSTSRGNSLVASGDLNNDGLVDLVYAQKDYAPESIGELQVFFGSSSGQWIPGPKRALELNPTELYVGNLDADLSTEIILIQTREYTSYEIATIKLNSSGQLTSPIVTTLNGYWQTHFAFDADQDGRLDFMGLDQANNTARVLFSRGDGTFRHGPSLPDSTGWSYPRTALVDGDSFPDLLFSNDRGSFVYLGNGDGTFRESYRGNRPYADMQTGDFDGDGHLDFADTQFDSTQIRVSFGDGTGKFPRAQHVETGRQYFALTTIDLQGDGLTDLVIDEGYGFQMARNTGNGFAPFEFVPLPFFAGRLESVDLNGDGYRDLLAAPGYSFNANQTQFTILPGLANGGFGESVTYSFPSFSVANPYLIDSNDDQRPELIVPTMNGFLLVPNFGATNPGDLNRDNEITPADIDLLCAAVVEGNSDVRFDLNQDAQVSTADVDYFLASIARTIPGDVNFDGVFNSSDLVSLFQIGKYEDGVPKNSRWSEGDFNCDGDFTTADFVMAFQIGGYSF